MGKARTETKRGRIAARKGAGRARGDAVAELQSRRARAGGSRDEGRGNLRLKRQRQQMESPISHRGAAR